MRKVKVLGTGCKKCNMLIEKVAQIAEENGIDIELEKVSDLSEIMSYGVMLTPALVVDGEIKSVGTVPSDELIKRFLTE